MTGVTRATVLKRLLAKVPTDGGKAIDIKVTAKVDGERMRGTAKIGDRAEGAFTAERTGS